LSAAKRGGSGKSGSSRWTRWIAYGLIAAYGIYWAFAAFTHHTVGNYAVETDFYWKYGPAARDLLRGVLSIENYDSKGWGYPIAVAAVSLLGFDLFRAGQLVALLSAVGSAWLLYRLHRSLFGPVHALASLLIVLANLTFLVNTYEVGTDMFFLLVSLAAVALLLRSQKPGLVALIASGLIGGSRSPRATTRSSWCPGPCSSSSRSACRAGRVRSGSGAPRSGAAPISWARSPG
jgi:hypothetical protein